MNLPRVSGTLITVHIHRRDLSFRQLFEPDWTSGRTVFTSRAGHGTALLTGRPRFDFHEICPDGAAGAYVFRSVRLQQK